MAVSSQACHIHLYGYDRLRKGAGLTQKGALLFVRLQILPDRKNTLLYVLWQYRRGSRIRLITDMTQTAIKLSQAESDLSQAESDRAKIHATPH